MRIRIKGIVLMLVLVIITCMTACVAEIPTTDGLATATAAPTAIPTATPTPMPGTVAQQLKVHYIDVGQGDSIFIELPNNRSILIDAGEKEYGTIVVNYIKNLGYSTIDYLVITHPHADHMGAMQYVIENMDIGKIYMPKASNNTKAFENMLLAIQNKGNKINEAKAGVNMLTENNLKIDFLAPNSTGYESLNNYSAVMKITYGQHRFLFMGDAETMSENEITMDVACDFVKVGHHGSTTSSGTGFVNRTGAKYAIIQVGTGNDYGHPKDTVLSRWENAGAVILRTDLNGTIVVSTNGSTYEIFSAKDIVIPEEPTDNTTNTSQWVLNTNTLKIHEPGCRNVSSIKPENYEKSTQTIAELINQGYTICGTCKPAD